jgi:hypothetical protein
MKEPQMKLRRIFVVPVIAALGLVVAPSPSASAVDIPAEALDFTVNVNPPSAAESAPNCGDPSTLFQNAITSGKDTVTISCSIDNPSQALTGTVSNSRLAQSDSGFNNGTFAATCRIQQQFTNTMTISGSLPNISIGIASISSVGLQVCSFALSFQDASKSTLTGTIELNSKMTGDSSTFADNKIISLSASAKVFITNGTGAFTGYVGSGTFEQSQTIDLNQQFSNLSTGSGPGGSTPPPSSDSAAQQTFCNQYGINPCSIEAITQYCQSNPQNCVAPSSVRTASVRKAATASKMTLKLKKGAGQVRITAPTPAAGKTKATVKATTKISLAGTPKAKCVVTTNTGKTVGSATVNKAGKATVRPAANAYKGATSVHATCTLNKKSFKSGTLKISAK